MVFSPGAVDVTGASNSFLRSFDTPSNVTPGSERCMFRFHVDLCAMETHVSRRLESKELG